MLAIASHSKKGQSSCNQCKQITSSNTEECDKCGAWKCFLCSKFIPTDVYQEHLEVHEEQESTAVSEITRKRKGRPLSLNSKHQNGDESTTNDSNSLLKSSGVIGSPQKESLLIAKKTANSSSNETLPESKHSRNPLNNAFVCNICKTNVTLTKEECDRCGAWKCYACSLFVPTDKYQQHVEQHEMIEETAPARPVKHPRLLSNLSDFNKTPIKHNNVHDNSNTVNSTHSSNFSGATTRLNGTKLSRSSTQSFCSPRVMASSSSNSVSNNSSNNSNNNNNNSTVLSTTSLSLQKSNHNLSPPVATITASSQTNKGSPAKNHQNHSTNHNNKSNNNMTTTNPSKSSVSSSSSSSKSVISPASLLSNSRSTTSESRSLEDHDNEESGSTSVSVSTSTTSTAPDVNSKDYAPRIEYEGLSLCPSDMGMGCGQTNPSGNRRCRSCNRVLQTKENSDGERLRLGQIVIFTRKSGLVIDKGILFEIAVNDDPDVVKVRYHEKVFRHPKYDEECALNSVHSTIYQSYSAMGTRVRKQVDHDIFTKETTAPQLMKRPKPTKEEMEKKLAALKAQGYSTEEALDDEDEEGYADEEEEEEEEEVETVKKVRAKRAPLPELPELDIDDDNADAAPAYDPALRKHHLNTPILSLDLEAVLSCVRFPCGRMSVGRLDRYHQRALLHWIVHQLTHNKQTTTVTDSKSVLIPPARSPTFLSRLTIELIEQVVSGCPVNEVEFATLPAARGMLDVRECKEGVIILLTSITDFLKVRNKRVVGTVRAGLQYVLTPHDHMPLFEDPSNVELEDLKKLSLSLPLSHYHFTIVLRLAFEALGGREGFECQRGVRGLEPTGYGSHAMYGGIKENLVEEMIQRTRLHKGMQFLDVGSGIGQVCIQVAATVGCQTVGLEIIRGRHIAAQKVLIAFDNVLKNIGVVGRVTPLVSLKKTDFVNEPEIISASDVIFLNNFGPWFESQHPDRGRDLNSIFSCMIIGANLGSQVLTMSPLVEASAWLDYRIFLSPPLASTWNKGRMNIFHYTITTKHWKCPLCTFLNIATEKVCGACDVKNKTVRLKAQDKKLGTR